MKQELTEDKRKVFKKDLINKPMYFPKITHDYYIYLYETFWKPYIYLKFQDKAIKQLNARKERIEDNMYLVIPSKA